MTEPRGYECIESAMLPFLFSNDIVHDISVGTNREVKRGLAHSRSFELGPNDVLEVLLIAPSVSLSGGTMNRIASLYSKINPTVTTNVTSRYDSDQFVEFEYPDLGSYTHKVAARVKTTGALEARSAVFMKVPSTSVSLIGSFQTSPPLLISTLLPGHEHWMNAVSVDTTKRLHHNDALRQHQSLHLLVRFTNLSPEVVHATVSGMFLFEKLNLDAPISPRIARQMPLGLNNYVIGKLFLKYMFVMHNPNDLAATLLLKRSIRNDVKQAIKDLAQDWKDLLSAVPGMDAAKLINFIIFYLE